jgi:very-short-patch-repair endonuclease
VPDPSQYQKEQLKIYLDGSVSKAEILFGLHLRELKLKFETQFQFCKDRRWKADFYLPEQHLLIEVHGSVWQQGRHTRGEGFESDREKMNTATMMGYRTLEFSTGQVEKGIAKEFLAEWLDL